MSSNLSIIEIAEIIRHPAILKHVVQSEELCKTLVTENYKCFEYIENTYDEKYIECAYLF
jgi:hypothetical protein